MRTMLLSRKVAKTIEVLRLGEADGGFQRTLSPGKLKGILRAVRGGVHVPGISVAVVGDRRIVIDGQHRLAAWMEAEFPLSVQGVPGFLWLLFSRDLCGPGPDHRAQLRLPHAAELLFVREMWSALQG